MVVNKGFSFNNIVSQYQIQEMYFPIRSKSTSEPCIVAISQGELRQIYSLNSYEEGSIAYEFASIDIEDNNAIIEFCGKYGLLYCTQLEENQNNDYMFIVENENNSSIEIPNENLYLSTFVREVITMRRFLDLKSALDSANLVSLVENVVKFLLSFTDRTHIPSDTETERFNYYFYTYIKHHYRFVDSGIDSRHYFTESSFNIQKALNDFLTDLNRYKSIDDEPTKELYFGRVLKFDDIYHKTWQEYHRLLSHLCCKTTIKSDPEGHIISFDPPLSDSLLESAGITLNDASITANACIADIMNSQTASIMPKLRFQNGSLTADWHITSLLEAMYMELQVTFAPNVQIRKCANPTCNYFFNIGKGNNRKIYCSQRCALLMAKRKQRERDRKKK